MTIKRNSICKVPVAGGSKAPPAAGVKRVAKCMPTRRGRQGGALETVMKTSVSIMRVLGWVGGAPGKADNQVKSKEAAARVEELGKDCSKTAAKGMSKGKSHRRHKGETSARMWPPARGGR